MVRRRPSFPGAQHAPPAIRERRSIMIRRVQPGAVQGLERGHEGRMQKTPPFEGRAGL
jgi:hypothetical protein